ncbi:MAG: crossover junction endodeoxyribonuclease RuvC [Chitinophagales bacterium]
MRERIILGIDPGTLHLGYGILHVKGSTMSVVCLGEVRLNKLENQQLKLLKIFEKIQGLIQEFKPDECAVECPFYGENVQSMLKLGRAQGVAMAAALHLGLPVAEYYPKKVKQSVTGNGNSTKEQVAAMLKTLCVMDAMPKSLDATDALAVAVCHHYQTSNPLLGNSKTTDWKSFITNNKDRVK